MAFDAPRKTLDDIRRELDAEFGETAAAQISSDVDAAERSPAPPDADADVRPVRRASADAPARRGRNVAVVSFDDDEDPVATARHDAAVVRSARLAMQPRRRGGYIAAGIIGCLVGQLILFGFMAVLRHRPVSAPSLEPLMERVGATPLVSSTPAQSASTTSTESETPSDRTASRVAVAPPAESESPSAIAPAPTAAAPASTSTAPAPTAAAPAPTVAPPAPVAPATPAAPPPSAAAMPETPTPSSTPAPRPLPPAALSIPPAVPPASIATPAPAASDAKTAARRVVKRTPTPPPPPPPVVAPPPASSVRPATHGVVDPPNWAASQEEVRAALSQWLASSGRADQSIVSDTVVFLGADGRTARTHVPMRFGSTVAIREQRWVRGPNGWALVDDREAWQGR